MNFVDLKKFRAVKGVAEGVRSRQCEPGIWEIAWAKTGGEKGLLLGVVRRTDPLRFWRYSRFLIDGERVYRMSGGVCGREFKMAGGSKSIAEAAKYLATMKSGEVLRFLAMCCERDSDADGNCDKHPAGTPFAELEPWKSIRTGRGE